MMEIKEGDQLYFVPYGRVVGPQPVTVEKVGRKWMTLSNRYRADRSSLELEKTGYGHGSPGTLFRTEGEYHALKERNATWRQLRDYVYQLGSAPSGISVDDIKAAGRLLGYDILSPERKEG